MCTILMMYCSQIDRLLPWACVSAFPGVQYFMRSGLPLSRADTVQGNLQDDYIMLTASTHIITSVIYNYKQWREFNIILDILHMLKIYQMIQKIILSWFCIYLHKMKADILPQSPPQSHWSWCRQVKWCDLPHTSPQSCGNIAQPGLSLEKPDTPIRMWDIHIWNHSGRGPCSQTRTVYHIQVDIYIMKDATNYANVYKKMKIYHNIYVLISTMQNQHLDLGSKTYNITLTTSQNLSFTQAEFMSLELCT